MSSEMPLVLFSGLAADESVFIPQKLRFPQLEVPQWLPPAGKESLEAYSRRLASNLGFCDQGVIGGASFGGIVALHVAQHLNVRAVLLIGSVKSPVEFPLHLKLARQLRPFVSFLPIGFLQFCCNPLLTDLAKRRTPHLSGLARQFYDSDHAVFKWSVQSILGWASSVSLDCPIYHIHGDRDRVLPIAHTSPDEVVRGGGHVISLTHPHQVNTFIDETLGKVRMDADSRY